MEMGGIVQDLPTWDTGIYAKILRDAAAAIAQQTITAAALWAACFGEADTWFDPDSLDAHLRPTETAAIRNVFRQARGARGLWVEWLDARDAAHYAGELETLALSAQLAARRAEVRAIRESQLPLPAPLGVAA